MSQSRNFEFYWLRKDILAGSSRPHTPENIDFIVKQGIKRIISISDPNGVRFLAKEFPIEVIPFEFEDFGTPSNNQLQSFFSLMDSSIKENKPVLVHCAMGCGRTGLLLTSYIMKFEKLDWKSSLSEVRKYRPCAVQSGIQLEYLEALEF